MGISGEASGLRFFGYFCSETKVTVVIPAKINSTHNI